MISISYVWIALGLVAVAIFGMLLWRISKRRVWMMYGEKRYCYLDVSAEGGRVYPVGGGKADCLGQVVLKSNGNYADVYAVNPENSDYDGRKSFVLVGNVNCKGEIRKGADPDSRIIGYTANPDYPDVLSCQGKWRTFLGFRTFMELDVYKVKEQGVHELIAKCETFRFPSPNKRIQGKMLDVVRAAAFMLLYKKIYDSSSQEYVEETPYGWLDTAFLSMLIYVLIYLVFYSVYCAALEMPFIGQSWQMGLSVALFYFAVWGVVRQVKIGFAESGFSIQPWLDLLNSKVGIAWITFVIWFFSIVSIVVSVCNGENNYELLPLQVVVIFGLLQNRLQKGKGLSEPWVIRDKYEREKTEEDAELKLMKPPSGTIQKSYEWKLGSRSECERQGQFSMFFDAKDMAIQKHANPFYMQRVDMMMADCIKDMYSYLTERNVDAMHRVNWVAKCIMEQSQELSELDRIQFVIDFVQEPNIKYCLDQYSRSVDYAVNYIRFPDETLYDKEGDADCKSFLAMMIFIAMGYNVVFMHSKIKNHSMIAVCPKNSDCLAEFSKDSKMQMKGKTYIFCECTGNKFFIGTIADGVKLADFETLVALPDNSSIDEE